MQFVILYLVGIVWAITSRSQLFSKYQKGMSYLLHVILFSYISRSLYSSAEVYSNSVKNGQELLLCRKCGADVADSHYLFSKPSPGARKVEKQNLFGQQNVTVQTLVNPFGIHFDVITTEKARCVNIGPEQGADSWFPGYSWRICACPHCGQHLGWTFGKTQDSDNVDKQPIDNIKSFHGLILRNILGENFTDSLIMMPKMYKM